MITVVVIVLVQYHVIHSIIVNIRRRCNRKINNRSNNNSNNNITAHHHQQVHMLNQYYTQLNAMQTITRQRVLPIASFQVICKIGCHPLKSFVVQLKRPFHHRHEFHRLHDWGMHINQTDPLYSLQSIRTIEFSIYYTQLISLT